MSQYNNMILLLDIRDETIISNFPSTSSSRNNSRLNSCEEIVIVTPYVFLSCFSRVNYRRRIPSLKWRTHNV